ncbi:acetyl-CoA synthetase-like protein [Aspergillus unguis]
MTDSTPPLKKVNEEDFDRTSFLTHDHGPEVLPNDLIFHMLRTVAGDQERIAIRDKEAGIEATHRQLLCDIMAFKGYLLDSLPPVTLEHLRAESEIPFLILSTGYEFLVSFFTVQALGGVAVPLSSKVTANEGIHILRTARAHAILTGHKYSTVAKAIRDGSGLKGQPNIFLSTPFLMTPVQDPASFRIASWRAPDQNKPALVIFTSGTTGPPKGSAMRRYTLLTTVMQARDAFKIGTDSTVVQLLPMHHATGLLVNTLPTVLGGGCVEFVQGGLDPSSIWERFLAGGLQYFSAVPTVYVRLMQYWEQKLAKLPPAQRDAYRMAVSNIKSFGSGTSKLPVEVQKKWYALTGTYISERYSGTEFGPVYRQAAGDSVVLGSVGRKNPLAHSKLSEGSRGEILVKSPLLFAKYINDPEGTRKAFTADGYFKTGDIARQEGNHFFIEGRSSVDILKSGGYKISALDVEQEILKHPKIAEASVLGLEDEEYGQRIAAAIVLKEPSIPLTLNQLRNDLRGQLSNYKLPTILRVVPALPKTETMKVQKHRLKDEFFKEDHPDIQRWTRSQKSKL